MQIEIFNIIDEATRKFRLRLADRERITVRQGSTADSIQLLIASGDRQKRKIRPATMRGVRRYSAATSIPSERVAGHRTYRGIAAMALMAAERDIRKLGYHVDLIVLAKLNRMTPEQQVTARSIAEMLGDSPGR